jgi:hypothetical protein
VDEVKALQVAAVRLLDCAGIEFDDAESAREIIRMRKPIRILVLVSTLFTGCASAPSPSASRIHDADTSMVTNCKYVGEVQGSSGFGNLAASAGMENAKNEAREQATKLDATHVVWNNVTGGFAPNASAKAYRCGS